MSEFVIVCCIGQSVDFQNWYSNKQLEAVRDIMPVTILHLPYNQGNFVASMQKAERALGASSASAARLNPFVNPPDIALPSSYWPIGPWFALYRKAKRQDILGFNYGSSLVDIGSRRFFLLDLPFYAKAQRKFVIFQGSDVRIKYRDAIKQSREYEMSLGYKLENTTKDGFIPPDEIKLKRKKVSKINLHVDRLFYFNPDLAQGLPKRAKFLPYPFLSPVQKPTHLRPKDRALRVLHLSTNRVLKGTGLIEKAIKAAQSHAEFDVKICVRVPREEAMKALNWADVLIDQVGLGWYGMQAVEALSLGKVVICSIDQSHWEQHMPDYIDKPSGILNATHETLAEKLVQLSKKNDLYEVLSQAAPAFVKDVHDPVKIVKAAYGDWINGHS